MIKANYHTHHKLCNHAVGEIKDYVEEAIKLGLEEIGLSDHGPVPRHGIDGSKYFKSWLNFNMNESEFYEIYLEQLEEAILKYSDKISILKAVETEYIEEVHDYYVKLKSYLDYMSLGLHFFKDSKGKFIGMFTDDLSKDDIIEYAKFSVKAMETKLYKIFVHPDVFMQTYKNENRLSTFDEYCEEAAHIIIKAAIKNDIYLEINTNGIRASKRCNINDNKQWFYPNYKFWQIVAQYKDVKVIIGSDAHAPSQIYDNDVQEAIDFAKEIGINIHDKIIL